MMGILASPMTIMAKCGFTNTSIMPGLNLIEGEATGNQFGISVSVSSNGTVLAVGVPLNDVHGFDAGHVLLYKYDQISNAWTQLLDDIVDGDAAYD